MKTSVTIDKRGRVVLPKTVRDELGLRASDALKVQISDGEIALRPVRARTRLRREDGMWVFTTGEPLPENMVEDTIEAIRRERDEQNLGKFK